MQFLNRYASGANSWEHPIDKGLPAMTARTLSVRVGDEIKLLEVALEKKRRLQALLNDNPVIKEALDLLNS